MTLPKILHFVWIGEAMPAWAERNLAEWVRLNPDHRVIIHTEKTLLPCFLDNFEEAKHLASKADLIRLSALKEHGGWYADIDFWPLRPLSDAVAAWGLDESHTFISKQQGHLSGDTLPYANGLIACGKDAPGLQLLIDLACKAEAGNRCAFGPEIVKKAVSKNPEAFTISEAAWWFPIPIKESFDAYPLLLSNPGVLPLATHATGHTMPYAAHLWAGAVDLKRSFSKLPDDRPVAIVQKVGKDDHALNAIADGLTAIGYNVSRVSTGADWKMLRRPSLIVCWNGRRDLTWRNLAAHNHCPILFVEHGFFQRGEYAQVDHKGFLHNASWVKNVKSEPPDGSADRLEKFIQHVDSTSMRPSGPILVLGQVDGDTQMMESEIDGAIKLLRCLNGAIPGSFVVHFRPHPLNHVAGLAAVRRFPRFEIVNENPAESRAEYAKEKHSTSLQQALASCRFAVAINSNSLVEAVTAGVPCLAFGPAIGIEAGAFRKATLGTAPQDIAAMLNGWVPKQENVNRFLQWLAARQWSAEELRKPEVIKELLLAAGAVVPVAKGKQNAV